MSRVGKLLVAHPNLPKDNWFYRSVIYLYQDCPKQGSLGLALNIQTNLEIRKLCYDKGILYPHNSHYVYKGGPVNGSSVIMMHTNEWSSTNTIQSGSSYSLSSDNLMFEKLALLDTPAYWRMFMGVCAWAPKQLDLEFKGSFPYQTTNSWLICDANDHIMFETLGEEQWEAAVSLSASQMIDSFF